MQGNFAARSAASSVSCCREGSQFAQNAEWHVAIDRCNLCHTSKRVDRYLQYPTAGRTHSRRRCPRATRSRLGFVSDLGSPERRLATRG